MKSLLQKSLKPLTIFASIVFALSIPSYFLLVDWIWLTELDENNELIVQRIENEFNDQQISDEKLEESIQFWNEIQSVGRIGPTLKPLQKDSVYTIRRQNPYLEKKSIDRFRGLITNIEINNKNFTVTIETNVEESEETMAYIAVVTLLFFLIMVVGFWILNRRLSAKLWKPFRSTLSKLKTFNLNSQTPIEFERSNTLEFEELNEALRKLIAHNISVYRTQKEFTENASHELQTPLAIIKNKLDLLLQKETVTDRQYQIIEEINRALTRSTRINKNLLLLAKIENHQFDDNETINISQLTQKCLEQFKEHANNKNIIIQPDIEPNIIIEGNKTLIEILLNNLVLNAIRHNLQNGTITIVLNKKELGIANSGNTALSSSAIFKRFAKVSNDSAGSGLGLAIIKQICNRHNWTINYQFMDNTQFFSIRL
ncbi:sensor histidine kinase [Olivibacter sp. SDN3]|uniref:PorY family sensor histidine kinase n=1 Tax=Olivibacter sp. SDN3 TaxID=2764720 RepID=UPI001650F9F5|nr:histidine kinase dimerization/phospho-acceptor domain-containing protein [Olivibacter sp. SDN3]QNL48749.1 sensor histidine kinase [Olivibacter sp. SDN3]